MNDDACPTSSGQGDVIDKLTIQMSDMEDSLQTSQSETTSLRQQITIFEQELVNSQDEVHEVMHALEQLAYDTKDREIESIVTEKQLLLEEMGSLQVSQCVRGACIKHILNGHNFSSIGQ